MSKAPVRVPDEATTRARIARGLRMVSASLPHLSGLAAAVRVSLDDEVPTMGIFASGRLVANRGFTARLSARDLVFVLAHELLHLALRTHDRARGANHLEFNYAHDYIINDMLRHALGFAAIPAGGLDMPGAREKSAEEIIIEMRRLGRFNSSRTQVWEGEIATVEQILGASRQAGPGRMGDVFDEARERAMFPQDSHDQAERAKAMRELAARGAGLAKVVAAASGRGQGTGSSQQRVRALRGIFRQPWQVVLQRWMEGVSPAERTFMRASRRGAEREDVVLPGRQRSSMLLNVILDTSASMTDEIPHALGAIADFCEATGVDEIRVVQCDTEVTADAVLSPVELVDYEVNGYGGSDLTPALALFAEDPRVTATVIITDGDITYPDNPVPFAVLWVVPGDTTTFTPRYGRVVTMPRGSVP